MNHTSKIIVSLLAAGVPLAASAVVPLPPPTSPLYVANFQTIEIDAINGSGNSTTFAYPGSPAVALDFNGSGNLFAVLESGAINRYDSLGNATTFANSGLNNPNAMAFDGFGNLYVANLGGGAGQGYVEKYNTQGVGSVFAMTGTIQASGGLAFDNSGNLYVAEEGNGTIVKYNSQGVGTLFLSGYQSYAMAYFNNYLYVATASDALYKVDSLGHAMLFANKDISGAGGMAFDAYGDLFVANEYNKTIAEFNSQGTGSIFATESYDMNGIAIVPEPATWTMLIMGAGIVLVKRRMFSRGA